MARYSKKGVPRSKAKPPQPKKAGVALSRPEAIAAINKALEERREVLRERELLFDVIASHGNPDMAKATRRFKALSRKEDRLDTRIMQLSLALRRVEVGGNG